VVFNDALRARMDARATGLPCPGTAALSKALITDAKQTPERAWLCEASAVVLQQSLRDLDAAYSNFFDSASGKRRGAKVAEPRFKSRKDCRQAIRFTSNARFKITSGRKLSLPKIGNVDVRWSRDLPAKPSSVTVVKDAAGRYFASFVVEVDAEQDATRFSNADPYAETGIDLGLTHFLVLASGEKVAAPKFLRRAEAARYGRAFAKIDQWTPTSQLCSACGVKDGPKPLRIRSWLCGGCGATHDRDVNAAKNILQLGKVAAGHAETLNACGARVRPGVILAPRREAGTRLGDPVDADPAPPGAVGVSVV
jgi:putative transposase